LESNNPAFRKNTFSFVGEEAGSMTMSGAINKTGILFVILMIGAAFGWSAESSLLLWGGMIAGLIAAFTIIYKRELAPYVAPIYAFAEGLFLGTLSVTYEAKYPGLAANAMTLTFGIMGVMLLCYRLGILKATPRFQKAVVIATMGIMVVYLVDFGMSFFSSGIPMIHQSGVLGIGISVVISGIAALNLILDFDLFEQATKSGAPKFMEWYCGFSLLVTLVWIYVEMLRLLSKLSRR
jgi:uncharacterized YccA/Bax inhibitor family protein